MGESEKGRKGGKGRVTKRTEAEKREKGGAQNNVRERKSKAQKKSGTERIRSHKERMVDGD